MVGAAGIKAGSAYVELVAVDKRLVSGLKRAQQRLQAFGASVRAIGARMLAAPPSQATKSYGLRLRCQRNCQGFDSRIRFSNDGSNRMTSKI